ncbi:septum site-determining protein MinC [Desulfotalea psychrophila]|uniref:Probable septum site-determining protein MinC n=1 Tax=Desulfotalea psychrophila (strain LSv54 / DSM 12343) TaxID=177439 RepID=Q6AQH8_DESPS|nr:septum site-determining protein MinC [Desulfotalea psychrophila]CAG35395.1 probable septum site-determining protein (MinC) [Desulfotalea psychrophila LSv54]
MNKNAMQLNSYRAEPFQFRARRHTMMVLYLLEPDHPDFIEMLQNKIERARNFFDHAPVIVDLGGFVGKEISVTIKEIFILLRRAGLIPLGVQGGDAQLQGEAAGFSIPVVPELGRRCDGQALTEILLQPPEIADSVVEDVAPLEAVSPTTLLITSPIRSGQRVYAEGGDLICTATVSAGAEVLADGNVHVYAPLRGRVYAGVKGDIKAGIFCKSLEAEFVSIAGNYKVSDQFDENIRKKSVHIFLQKERLLLNIL